MPCSAFRVPALLLALGVALAGNCAAQEFSNNASRQFETLDVNHDGVLSKYEYDSDVVLAALDSDHNNRISAAELQVFLGPEKDGAPSATYRIGVADRDNDGELSIDELSRGSEMRFNWLDANKDGAVDLPELQAGFGIPMVR